MLCDKCRQNEANVHVTRIVNGVKYEQNLCSHCAKAEAAHEHLGGGSGSGLEQLVSFLRGLGMIGVVMAPGAMRGYQSAPVTIEDLGLTLPSCTGEDGAPQGASLEALKAELTAAVANEKYERAAELRDAIFQMEQHKGRN